MTARRRRQDHIMDLVRRHGFVSIEVRDARIHLHGAFGTPEWHIQEGALIGHEGR